MAALPNLDRVKVAAHLGRKHPWPGLTKPDIKAAVDAIDDYIDTNAATMNAALPQPFRTIATLEQKARLFAYVALRRGGLLTTEND
jgi:hypothetical protein